ncbi:MAG: hypothetical protein sL5_04210 [Candidatus Mesenet longicola]|uniref:Uncharacterized protein n=1 Tax=Candidatus Mesenet longicola TaxID=1892558 RepID=A0A8J3HPS1_9RICK|nr:MAG: hypothetical protein sGL2_04120 [Candidatus Mesenet longicola]GHM59428.1 MAG: hypothetical protein sL5_04210 [Candidatus Mesenet longicola]
MNDSSQLINNNIDSQVNFLKDWYTPKIMKASLGDITTKEYIDKKTSAIIAVQSESSVEAYGLENDKKQDQEAIRNAVSKEFEQALQLLDKTKLPVCFIRGIPHYDEGYQAQIAGHYVFLYFFHDNEGKKSVLVVDPQGSKFGDRLTDQKEKAIDEEFVDIIRHAAKENEAQIYVSQDVIQQDGRSCGPVSVELARAFYEASSNENKKEKLFEILKDSQLKSTKLNDNSTLEYQLCKLGNSIISQKIIDDFNNKVKHEFTDNGKKSIEEVGGQKIREAHYHASTLINEKGIESIKSGEENYDKNIKPFLKELGASDDLLSNICSSFKSGIITGTPFLNQEQIQQAQQKRGEILGTKKQKRVSINPSNKHKSSKSESHNNAQDHKPAEKSEFSKIIATTAAFIGVALLCSAILIDIKKEFKIGGIVLSSVMLISAVTCFFLPGKTQESKMTIDIETPLIKTTTATVQLP